MLMKAIPSSDLWRFKVDNETSQVGRAACTDSIIMHYVHTQEHRVSCHLVWEDCGLLITRDVAQWGSGTFTTVPAAFQLGPVPQQFLQCFVIATFKKLK